MTRVCKFLLLLLIVYGKSGCVTHLNHDEIAAEDAFVGPPQPERTAEEIAAEQLEIVREEIARQGDRLREELREVIVEEILPEIWTEKVERGVSSAQKQARRAARERMFLGRVEWIRFNDPAFEIQARVDTGAQTSSLHAENIKEQTINGELYVQFETLDQNDQPITMVRRVVAKTNVRNTAGQTSQRYVIRETIALGNRKHEVNINLNDRQDLRYKFLVGRNLLIGNYVVDVSKSHLLGDKL